MNALREMVAGKKNRLKDGQYNLDLTYVTKRIIAMSFPGEGLSGFYRNPIDQVAQLLNETHQDNYFIINLCGKKYNYSKFVNGVIDEFIWEDHHSPTIGTLFKAVQVIHSYLRQGVKNVVAIHCLAGKGRTGTVICCYLLFTGKFKSVEDVLYYYGKKRFLVEGLGVNQPCQIRYIYYFFELIKGERRIFPQLFQLKCVRFHSKPSFNYNGGCKPYFKVTNLREYHNNCEAIRVGKEQKQFEVQECKPINNFQQESNQKQPFGLEQAKSFKIEGIHQMNCQGFFLVFGDVLFNFFNVSMISSQEKMFRLAFNTAFHDDKIVDDKLKLSFTKQDLDPSQILKDNRFPQDFVVEIELAVVCGKCRDPDVDRSQCDCCWGQLKEEANDWKFIQEFLSQYNNVTQDQAVTLLFGDKKDDDVESIFLKQSEVEITTKSKSHSISMPLEKL